jgi:hypothetical protein
MAKIQPITPFEAALLHKARTGDDAVVKVMLRYRSQLTVTEAAVLGRTDLLRSLLSISSLLVNSTDPSGRTARNWALLEHEWQIALFLIDHGAIPTPRTIAYVAKQCQIWDLLK